MPNDIPEREITNPGEIEANIESDDAVEMELSAEEIAYLKELREKKEKERKKEEEIERLHQKQIEDGYDSPSRHQYRRIRDATGIPTEWLNTFNAGWTFAECTTKIRGITVYGNPAIYDKNYTTTGWLYTRRESGPKDKALKNQAIDNCVEELVNSISLKRKYIRQNYNKRSKNPAVYTVEFAPFYLNQIKSICKDKLYKKIKTKIPKAKTKLQKKNLETFISKWKINSKKEVKENYSRMKDDVDVEEYVSIFQGKQDMLSKIIHKKDGEWHFRISKGEDETRELKDSFFANLERVKEEWNDKQNNEKGKKSVPKTVEEWLKRKDIDVQSGILKCVCSFLNSKGGKIWLGVRNDGKIIGISNVKKREQYKNSKNFEIVDDLSLRITQALENTFPEYYDSHIETNTPALRPGQSDDQQLIVIDVRPTYPAGVFIERRDKDGKPYDVPYHRVGSKCLPMSLKEFLKYRDKRGDKTPNKKKS